MIEARQLQHLAAELLSRPQISEERVRTAVSLIYYGFFHHLTGAAAAVFDQGEPGGRALAAQVTRAFSHSTLQKVCKTYRRSRQQSFPPPLDGLHLFPPDERLFVIADAFVTLQEAREIADYDLQATLSQPDALALLEQAEFAYWKLEEIRRLPETRIFLAALLVADRWTRRV